MKRILCVLIGVLWVFGAWATPAQAQDREAAMDAEWAAFCARDATDVTWRAYPEDDDPSGIGNPNFDKTCHPCDLSQVACEEWAKEEILQWLVPQRLAKEAS